MSLCTGSLTELEAASLTLHRTHCELKRSLTGRVRSSSLSSTAHANHSYLHAQSSIGSGRERTPIRDVEVVAITLGFETARPVGCHPVGELPFGVHVFCAPFLFPGTHRLSKVSLSTGETVLKKLLLSRPILHLRSPHHGAGRPKFSRFFALS